MKNLLLKINFLFMRNRLLLLMERVGVRLKASTLIEGIVAMVIILTCATIGFTALTKQRKGINSALRVEAEMNIAFVITEAKFSGKLLDASFDYENMRIDMQILDYQKYKNIKLLVCQAFTPQNERICDYREIIEIKK
jgi:hypothetical protein